jgi:hypothetical protein
MPDNSYAVTGAGEWVSGATNNTAVTSNSNNTTSFANIRTHSGGSATDSPWIGVGIFR